MVQERTDKHLEKKLNPNTKDKNGIFILVVIFIIISGTIFAGLLFYLVNSPSDSSSPLPDAPSDPDVIEIDPDEEVEYKFAAITSADTIKLYSEKGESIDINLGQRSWTNLKWSEDGTYLTVLGNRLTEDLLDLNLYDTTDKRWRWITEFSGEEIGISTYEWQNNETLFFMQGLGNGKWFHRYSYPTRSEILKVVQVDGDILDFDTQNSRVAIKHRNSGVVYLYNEFGEEIWETSSLVDEEGQPLVIENLVFTQDAQKIIFTALDNSSFLTTYKTLIGSDLGVKVPLPYEFIPTCALNADVALGYVYDPEFDTFIVGTVNVRNNSAEIFYQNQSLGTEVLDLSNIHCFETNKILFGSQKVGEEKRWYEVSVNGKEQLNFLIGSIEVRGRV